MPVLMLSEQDVRQLLTIDMALEAVEEALRKMGLDEAENIPRARCRTDQIMLHLLGGAAKTIGYAGYKVYSTGRTGAHFHVGLYDGKSGELVALMQADYLGQVRTGAASGVATRYMARDDAAEVGLFGTGKQARTQALAICRVRAVRRIQVFSRSEEHRRRFAEEMQDACQCEIEPVARPEAAAEKKDIVITATASREPVLHGVWLAEGTHVNAIGSNFLSKAEIDVDVIRRSRTIVVDSKDQARFEAGDFHQALDEGLLKWSGVYELGQVVVGRYPGRQQPQDITLFKSVGIGLEDVAVAARVYRKAREQGVGQLMEYWDSP
jgi:ornithine cyclodeaminase/alanine dehydrogenase-like protein (mu-crystallin family)